MNTAFEQASADTNLHLVKRAFSSAIHPDCRLGEWLVPSEKHMAMQTTPTIDPGDLFDAAKVDRLVEKVKIRRDVLSAIIAKAVTSRQITQNTANKTQAVLDYMMDMISGVMSVPLFEVMSEGRTLLTWDNDEHHFDIEFIPDDSVEYFYKSYDNNPGWGCELSWDTQPPAPNEALRKLGKFRVIK